MIYPPARATDASYQSPLPPPSPAGSVPFVPPGVQVDEQTVFTSDGGLRLERVPEYVAIIGSGYIGLEFSDVYTALGAEVTFIEAMDRIMPTFDPEIARVAERLLIKPRAIDYRTSVFASKVTPGIPGQKPVTIEMIDAKTKELVEVLEVDACMVATGRVPNTKGLGLENMGIETVRGFVQVRRLAGRAGAFARSCVPPDPLMAHQRPPFGLSPYTRHPPLPARWTSACAC